MPTEWVRLDEVDPLVWDRLAGDHALATHGWLSTVEGCSRGPIEPHYLIHRANGAIAAAAVCYVVTESSQGETLDHVMYGRLTPAARSIGLSMLPALICGPLLGYGWHIGLDPHLSPADRGGVIAAMMDAMEAAARARGVRLHFPHVMTDERELRHELHARGYLACRNVPVAVLDVRWPTFDAYLDHLPQRVRSEIRRQIKHNRAAGTTIDTTAIAEAEGGRVLELLDANSWKHSRLRFALNERAFAGLAERLDGRARLITAAKDGALTAACLVVGHGRCAYAVAVGVDQARAGIDYTYFHVTYNTTIAAAIDGGLARVYFGRGLYDVKLRRGCRLENTWLYSRAPGPARMATAAWFEVVSFWTRFKLPRRARRLLSTTASE